MQQASKKQLFTIVVEFPNGNTKEVKVKAVDRDAAEERALKFNPNATKVQRG